MENTFAMYKNHQLYLAERTMWLDRHVVKSSIRALMKIKALQEHHDDMTLIQKLVYSSLLMELPNKTVLNKEGFFLMNLNN
jgi:hypothetical protein